MKKTAIVLAGVMLAGAALSLAGCDDGSIGKVDGNFKNEATAEQIYSKEITDIDVSQSFDAAKGFGFELKEELEFSMNMTMRSQGETVESKMSGDVNAEYKFTAALPEGEQVPLFLGAGKFSMNMETSSKAAGMNSSSEMEVNGNAYNDTEYVYLDATISAPVAKTESVKCSIADIMDQIGDDVMPDFPLVDYAEVSGGITADYELSAMLVAMQEQGFKIYLDISKGVKVKISAGEEIIKGILSETEIEIPTDALTFSSCVFDIYLVFDADGKFTQLGVDVDIEASLNVQEGGTGISASLNVEGGVSLKTYSGTVTIPAGIAEDEKYKLQSF